MAPYWRWFGPRLELQCQVQPGAASDRLVGEHGGRLRVRVNAPAHGGAANERLRRVLGEAFGVPVSAVTIERGHASRFKTLVVHSPACLPAALAIARET